jgi:hypothetical protein
VLADGVVVGRSFKANAGPVGSPWMWTLAFGHHKDRTPTHGYADTRGRDGVVRQELAAGIGRSLINAQIAAVMRLLRGVTTRYLVNWYFC